MSDTCMLTRKFLLLPYICNGIKDAVLTASTKMKKESIWEVKKIQDFCPWDMESWLPSSCAALSQAFASN